MTLTNCTAILLVNISRILPLRPLGLRNLTALFLTSNQVSQADFESGATSLKLTDLPYEAGRSDPNDPSQLHLYALDETGQLLRPVEIIF